MNCNFKLSKEEILKIEVQTNRSIRTFTFPNNGSIILNFNNKEFHFIIHPASTVMTVINFFRWTARLNVIINHNRDYHIEPEIKIPLPAQHNNIRYRVL